MITFGQSVRQPLGPKTPSPGSIYNLEGLFRNGRDKTIPISFPTDVRKPVINETSGASVDLLFPEIRSSSPKQSIGKRINRKDAFKAKVNALAYTYEVEKYRNFKTGPSFTFGKSRVPRFKDEEVEFDINRIFDKFF